MMIGETSDMARKLQDARYSVDEALKYLMTVSTVMHNLKQCEIEDWNGMSPIVETAYKTWRSRVEHLRLLIHQEALADLG